MELIAVVCHGLLTQDHQGRIDHRSIRIRTATAFLSSQTAAFFRAQRPCVGDAVKLIALGDPETLRLPPQTCPAEIAGYLLNEMPAVAFMQSLHLIVSGRKIYPPGFLAATLGTRPTPETPIRPDETNRLSAREKLIPELLLVEPSTDAIAHAFTGKLQTMLDWPRL